ncbi:DUF86 domain-containing protein [Acidovorax sp.]|uniref:HepT-like ribonuclease domain-containing protein n=1 Tax=Acidovorax sp. TaxID=1872122 RepID=UPI002ACE52C6|nr:HepT-like ribonuclease domain-containing protein [Acidovorax sp.]MDZ7862250.1 HepT-like ribonuclease domain-containing protein [Acidovorax sp.]
MGNIQDYTAGADLAGFMADRKTQDAVIRNLEVIGEASVAMGAWCSALAALDFYERNARHLDLQAMSADEQALSRAHGTSAGNDHQFERPHHQRV